MSDVIITEDWLAEIGFKWHTVERAQHKHWILWLGDAVAQGGFTCREDLGVELTFNHEENFYCWLRGDYSHRYSRFIHIRHIRTQRDLIRLIEGLTGLDWNPQDVWYGSLLTPEYSAKALKHSQRLDRRFVEGSHPWNESERDGTRGYPMSEHQDFIEGKLPTKTAKTRPGG